MFILGVNMVFRLKKSSMSLCPFTKILAPPITPFFDGLDKIQTGSFELQKGKSPGRPISASNAANVQKVNGSIDENCRLSYYELESITGIPKTTVHGILGLVIWSSEISS